MKLSGTKKLAALLLLPFGLLAGFAIVGLGLLFAMFLFASQEEPADPGGGFAGGPISAIGANEIPAEYIPVYQAAAKKYNVPWNLLAAIHRVETRFSTIGNMESYAGAIGHLQFMPCTWVGWSHPSCGGLGRGNIDKAELRSLAVIQRHGGFGIDGDGDGYADPFSLPDAIFSAARYLADSGAASGDYERAVFTYNHSQKYVSDVLGFMKQYVDYQPIVIVPGTGGFIHPSPSPISSRYGARFHPVLKIWRLHAGIDFDCATGDPIIAAKSGVVTYSGWQNANNPKAGLGQYVWIEHGGGLKTAYGHMSRLSVQVGQMVEAGTVVGACGTTGTSTGDHLHFEIYQNGTQVDPAPFLGL